MAPGVRKSKRVRVVTQSDVLPSESKPRTSKRHLVQEHTTPSDDNAAAEECNATVAHDNTSEEGNEAVAHDNAYLEQDIGAANDDLSFPEGKFSFTYVISFVVFEGIKLFNQKKNSLL
jgi:hypothetical protein